MNRDIIISCAVTGAGDTVGRHAGVPVTPQQIADACIDAANAGAAITHIHVRNLETKLGSRDPQLFKEVVDIVKANGTDVIINLTAGMGGDWVLNEDDPNVPGPGSDMAVALERLAHVELIRPDICSLDCGTMNFGTGHELYINSTRNLEIMAKRVQELGVTPELEVFDLGQVRCAKHLIAKGLIDAPALFQICLGISWGAGADTASMLAMRNELPAGANWFSFGVGSMQMPMVAQAMLLGGNVRVGLEDNLYLERGKLATNGELVAKAGHIIGQLGGRVVGADEARTKLGIK